MTIYTSIGLEPSDEYSERPICIEPVSLSDDESDSPLDGLWISELDSESDSDSEEDGYLRTGRLTDDELDDSEELDSLPSTAATGGAATADSSGTGGGGKYGSAPPTDDSGNGGNPGVCDGGGGGIIGGGAAGAIWGGITGGNAGSSVTIDGSIIGGTGM